jgi:hypothetical protein
LFNSTKQSWLYVWVILGAFGLGACKGTIGPGPAEGLVFPATATATPVPDQFEDDDDVESAMNLPDTISYQTHTFHDPGDIDWLVFTPLSAPTFYTFETNNLAAGVDTKIAIYANDKSTLLFSNDNYLGGPRSRMNYPLGITSYYIKIIQMGTAHGPDAVYSIRGYPDP